MPTGQGDRTGKPGGLLMVRKCHSAGWGVAHLLRAELCLYGPGLPASWPGFSSAPVLSKKHPVDAATWVPWAEWTGAPAKERGLWAPCQPALQVLAWGQQG